MPISVDNHPAQIEAPAVAKQSTQGMSTKCSHVVCHSDLHELGSVSNVDADGVEEGLLCNLVAQLDSAASQHSCQAVHAGGDALQAFWAVVDGIQSSDVRQQGLGSSTDGRV